MAKRRASQEYNLETNPLQTGRTEPGRAGRFIALISQVWDSRGSFAAMFIWASLLILVVWGILEFAGVGVFNFGVNRWNPNGLGGSPPHGPKPGFSGGPSNVQVVLPRKPGFSTVGRRCKDRSRMALFEASIEIARAPADVFDFLIRPALVLQTLPDNAGIRYIDVPEVLTPGVRIEFDLTIVGPPQRCVQEISEFVRPGKFVESQISGPLPVWRHEHVVETDGAGGSRVTDRIEFAPPGGLAGFLITEDRIRDSLVKGFAHRHGRLKEILEAGGAP